MARSVGPFRTTRPPDTVAGRVLDRIAARIFSDFPPELLKFGIDQTLLAKELDRRFASASLNAHHAWLTKVLESEFTEVVASIEAEMIKW